MEIKLKDILSFIKPGLIFNKRITLFYMIAMAFIIAVGLIMPYISGLYIDELTADIGIDTIWMFVIAFAAVYAIQILSNLAWTIVNSLFCNSFFYVMVISPMKHVMKSRFSEYVNVDAAKFISRLATDGDSFLRMFRMMTATVVGVITISFSLFMLFSIDFFVGTLVFAILPIYIILYMVFKGKVFERTRKFNTASDIYFSKRNEQINRIAFIKRNELIDELGERVDGSFKKMLKANLHLNLIDYFFSDAGAITNAIFHIIIIGFGGYQVITGQLSIGFFTMIILYFQMVVREAGFFFMLGSSYQSARASAERTKRIYQNPLELNGDICIDCVQELALDNLSFSYGNHEVFSGVSKTFQSGKIYAICGENGSGKSSLLNCIVGLYPDLIKGDILFDGVSISKINMSYMRRNRIAFIEQMPEFLNMSIDEFLDLGIEVTEATRENKRILSEAFGLSKFNTRDEITESGSNFSGGEKQKIAIARALSKDCAVAILDEPTSALDAASVDVLINALKRQKPGRITLIVSHDPRILDLCDEIWYIA